MACRYWKFLQMYSSPNYSEVQFPIYLDLRKILTIFFCSYFSKKLLIQHGDIDSNSGPSKKHRPLTCHWNVNSLTVHKMLKISLIEAYNTSHKYDFTCISETYLDSTLAADDKDLAIEGYNPLSCRSS